MDKPDVTLAVTRDYLIGIGPLVLGVLVVAMLILAVWLGLRRRSRDSGPPDPEEQPRRPAEPIGYETQWRELDELEPEETRRLPQEMHGQGTSITRPSQPEAGAQRRTWYRGGSSHGSG